MRPSWPRLTAVLVAVLGVLAMTAPAHAQLVSLTLQGDDHSLVPHISGSINGPGLAAGIDGTLAVGGAGQDPAAAVANGNAWGALVFRDLDRVQIGLSAGSHPSLLAPASYLRAAYDEIAVSATGYPIAISRLHADRPPSVLAFLGTTVSYDQRNYRGVDPNLAVDRVLTLGENLFGLVIASPEGQLPMHFNVMNNNLALELAGNNVVNTAFRYSLSPIEIDNWQLTKADAKTGSALYLNIFGSFYAYKPPIYHGGFDFSVQLGLGGKTELHYSNARGSIGLGAWRTPDLGITAETSGLEDRAYVRAAHVFWDKVDGAATAFVGVVHQQDGLTNQSRDVKTGGVAGDIGYAALDWLDVGVRGDFGRSPYLQSARSSPLPTVSVTGYDVGVFARVSWASSGQGAATGVPAPH